MVGHKHELRWLDRPRGPRPDGQRHPAAEAPQQIHHTATPADDDSEQVCKAMRKKGKDKHGKPYPPSHKVMETRTMALQKPPSRSAVYMASRSMLGPTWLITESYPRCMQNRTWWKG